MFISVMTLILYLGGEYEMDDENYYLSGSLDKNIQDKIYIWFSEPTNFTDDLVRGNTILVLSKREGIN